MNITLTLSDAGSFNTNIHFLLWWLKSLIRKIGRVFFINWAHSCNIWKSCNKKGGGMGRRKGQLLISWNLCSGDVVVKHCKCLNEELYTATSTWLVSSKVGMEEGEKGERGYNGCWAKIKMDRKECQNDIVSCLSPGSKANLCSWQCWNTTQAV